MAAPKATRHAEMVVYNVADIPEACQKSYAKAPNVGVAVKVIAISDLDMSSHRFSADFNLNVAWNGEKDDEPAVQLYNAVEINQEDKADPKKGDAGFDWYYRIRFQGTFRSTFDLRMFPYDSQELKVVVRLKSACRLVHLPWDLSGSASSCDPRCMSDDFVVTKGEVRPVYLPSLKFGKLSGYDPEAHVVFTVKRKPVYWVMNFGFITTILASFSFLSFALPVEDISGRLGIGFTLNLTVVASYYLMSDKLPSAPYFTLLEKHILLCMAITMLVLLEGASPAVLGEKVVSWFERYVCPILLVVWIVYHVWQWVYFTQHDVQDELE